MKEFSSPLGEVDKQKKLRRTLKKSEVDPRFHPQPFVDNRPYDSAPPIYPTPNELNRTKPQNIFFAPHPHFFELQKQKQQPG